MQSDAPRRVALRSTADLLDCMASTYKIDSYQQQYFVIDSFEALVALTEPDFTPHYQALARHCERSAAIHDPSPSHDGSPRPAASR